MADNSRRVEIPIDVAAEVLFQADRTCCVCRQRLRPIQLHHIDDDPTNSVAENLAVLCFDCHRETQIHGGFDRKLDAAQVRLFKSDWNRRVETQRSTGAQAAARSLATGEAQVLRYFQIRDKSEEYFYDFEADYVLVGSSDEAADAATNLYINAFITSSHQSLRESSISSAGIRQQSKTATRSRAAYWDRLAISHKVSLYTPNLLSLEFQTWSYGAGAAHGNSTTKTMNFRLHPSKQLQLRDVLNPSTNYLGRLSEYCLEDIRKQQSRRQSDADMGPDTFEKEREEWRVKGTAAVDRNYERFSFTRNGITIHFDPYHVACYADGKYEVFIPAYVLKPLIKDEILGLTAWD